MRILLIQGHPDSNGQHFDDAIAAAYRDGAQAAGHELREVKVAQLDLNFVGIRPVRLVYFGRVEGSHPKRREVFLARVRRWGARAA